MVPYYLVELCVELIHGWAVQFDTVCDEMQWPNAATVWYNSLVHVQIVHVYDEGKAN